MSSNPFDFLTKVVLGLKGLAEWHEDVLEKNMDPMEATEKAVNRTRRRISGQKIEGDEEPKVIDVK